MTYRRKLLVDLLSTGELENFLPIRNKLLNTI